LRADNNEVNFYVDDIKPVNWNDDAYDHLVYHEEQKDLLLSFVDNHKILTHGVDDVIVGKGQGLIVLLSGPPGTGKTLTAEAGKFSRCLCDFGLVANISEISRR
jgi:SpoVK/Ycf46/Vps4 family AAA+-type ATPase